MSLAYFHCPTNNSDSKLKLFKKTCLIITRGLYSAAESTYYLDVPFVNKPTVKPRKVEIRSTKSYLEETEVVETEVLAEPSATLAKADSAATLVPSKATFSSARLAASD